METEKKRSLEKGLDRLFAEALENGVFPGAAVGIRKNITSGNNFTFARYYGYTDCLEKSFTVTESTVFDLASLTKPLTVVFLLLPLLEKGTFRFDTSLADLLPGFTIPEDKRDICLWQLMSHCSGLPAHRPYYKELLGIARGKRKEHVIRSILQEPLEQYSFPRHIYSDLGYILIGYIIELRTGKSLQSCLHDALEPLGLASAVFYPEPGRLDISTCAATETCPWTNTKLCGTVHDDNCRMLGGQAGHAGVFGTMEGVLGVCEAICRGWHGSDEKLPVSANLLQKITRRVNKSTWTCGFDTPTKLYSSSGRYFSTNTIGHLGFTGTSFWIDLERNIEVVFLSNRVCPSRKNEKIKKFRPKLHDTIMKEMV